MKKIDSFINLYPVTKTLKFKLIPVGKTQENFDNGKLLEEDKKRSENYIKAKEIIDKYYNDFINNCLNNFVFSKNPNNLLQYYEIYNKNYENKKEKEEELNQIKNELRDEIVYSFKDSENKRIIYDKLFKGELLDIILKDNRIPDKDKEVIEQFDKFKTYFQRFFSNRKNIFSNDNKAGSISYRLINENLKIYVDNMRVWLKIKDIINEDLKDLQKDYKDLLNEYELKDMFDLDYYNLCLTGDDINRYNKIIGGYSIDEKIKVKGLNEYINLYNQKNKVNFKLPRFKQLYKQILSLDESKTFRFDIIDDDKVVYGLIDKIIEVLDDKQSNILETLNQTFEGLLLNKYDIKNIYLSSKKFTDLSQKIFGDYNVINYCISIDYDKQHRMLKNKEKYEKEKDKYIKSIEYLSINQIALLLTNSGYDRFKLLNRLKSECEELILNIIETKNEYKTINKNYSIRETEYIVENIKKLLDALLNLYRFKESFCTYSDLEEIDMVFYGELGLIDFLKDIISVYNRVRNYLTKKPYKIDKIKLNFNCSTLLDGWDVNKEKDNLGVLLLKDNKYYLGIMNKMNNKVFVDAEYTKINDSYLKINYKLLPDPKKMLPKVFLSKKGIETYNPDKKIIDNYNKGTHIKGTNYRKEDMVALIEYFKKSIKQHVDYSNFGFKFSDSNTFDDISQFYKEVENQGYKITYSNIPSEYINKLVDEGKIFLYQIYNKDFSSHSKGIKNLHTLYFEQLFNKYNIDNVVYKLNGQAEVFLREKSIEPKITHQKNKPIQNKNRCNNKKESIFEYDLMKDKRYARDQFEFHIPITINFKAGDGSDNDRVFNDRVKAQIKECDDNYVIGIDRGERNLIYINVISEKYGLVLQSSLNEIVNEYNGNIYKTDYHDLLDKKEKERDNARKSWQTISNIKELKEGYISQVVHKICELVEKYDAIIVMEDLNAGFKKGRIKVEKQVYQKFEKMLIDKLNLYINKKSVVSKNGGLYKGYQLTRPYKGNKQMSFQNGFIFYVAPWNTSKIDPTTGFVNLFRLGNYLSTESKREFIKKFDSIMYNSADNVFEFKFTYSNFEYGSIDYKQDWIITSNGTRICAFRNKEKNNNYDYKEVDLTLELKNLLSENNIDYQNCDIKTLIYDMDKRFYDKLFEILKLMLQMRNSKPQKNMGEEVIDYLISPVKNSAGYYYNSNVINRQDKLPIDADSNGAYNIARKGLMIIERIKNGQTDRLTIIQNKEWLEYAQTHYFV